VCCSVLQCVAVCRGHSSAVTVPTAYEHAPQRTTLHRTAPHCNTPQRTTTRHNATHYNALQHTTTHHNTPHCTTLQHTATYHTTPHHPVTNPAAQPSKTPLTTRTQTTANNVHEKKIESRVHGNTQERRQIEREATWSPWTHAPPLWQLNICVGVSVSLCVSCLCLCLCLVHGGILMHRPSGS